MIAAFQSKNVSLNLYTYMIIETCRDVVFERY